ncbi:MAG: LamG domain-containing protein [Bryobacteraceae bacterium]
MLKSRALLIAALLAGECRAGVVATWLFDEQTQAYPSSVLSDCGPNGYSLVLGRGARLVPGRFGHALAPSEPEPLDIRGALVRPESASARLFGLVPSPIPAGRHLQPMWWQNATFAGLLTAGEKHLRTPDVSNPSDTKLNLGAFDWTVEFWYQTRTRGTEGVVFEIGQGPRGENEHVTRLTLSADRRTFRLLNEPSASTVVITTDEAALTGSGWHHLAFTYTAADGQVRHYVDGKLQTLPPRAQLRALTHGDEAYFTVGRDSAWGRPLSGLLDELRFSDNVLYAAEFTPPATFSKTYAGGFHPVALKRGPPLLFVKSAKTSPVIELGSRRHLFIDDAFIAQSQNIAFVPNPPKRMEKVADEVRGHLTMVDDQTGLLRITIAARTTPSRS